MTFAWGILFASIKKYRKKTKAEFRFLRASSYQKKHGSEAGGTITVRRVSSGIGMEKTFPIYAPLISKIEVLKRSKVRRSKLYYIRDKAAKEARKKMKQLQSFIATTVADETVKSDEKKEEKNEDKDGMKEAKTSETGSPSGDDSPDKPDQPEADLGKEEKSEEDKSPSPEV